MVPEPFLPLADVPATEELILAASPMMYVKLCLQGTECPALIDSGASGNFISEGFVRQLNLRVRDLTQPCDIRAANGELMPCKHCAIVRARLGELPFSLTLRVVPTDLRVILGYPFLRFSDPEIYWRDRVMRITKGERVFNVPMGTNTPH